LKLDGKEEVLTIHVLYDTRELYGKIKGTREVRVTRE